MAPSNLDDALKTHMRQGSIDGVKKLKSFHESRTEGT
jgi:hypothetical protein